jgi:hypothetical protein
MADFSKNGKPWTTDEELALLKEYNEDKLTLLDLVINHKRKPVGIFGRLKKLNIIKAPKETRGYDEYTNSDIYRQLKKVNTEVKKEKEKDDELVNLDPDIDRATSTHDMVKKILSILEKVYRT